MIKKLVHNLLQKRHFWRDVGFDELSELYISMMFRSVAIGSIGVFVPIYLFRMGYSLTDIFSVYAWFATSQSLFGWFSAHLVARFGPKHVILISYIVQLLSSLLFLSQDGMRWPLWMLGGVWGIAANLFFVAYHVDFSKIKHTEHSGKEVGYMYMMQKVGFTVGPLLGGFAATFFGAAYVFLIAALLLVMGVIPLFRTSEPVRIHQKLDFKLSVGRFWRGMVGYMAFATEDSLTKTLWPAYVGILILGAHAYATLGALSSASVAFSILVTYMFGRLADNRSGRSMLRIFAVINTIIHGIRPFISNLPQAIGINLANDAVTIGYTLPFVKGMYAAADDLPGYRIVYVATMEIMANAARALTFWILAAAAYFLTIKQTLTIGFVLAGVTSLLIMIEHFPGLVRRKV